MVTTRDNSKFNRLDGILEGLCARHKLKLYVTGWTRKTYDLYQLDGKGSVSYHLIRIESLATENGEIQCYNEQGATIATELGLVLEREFGIPEATIVVAEE